MLETNRLILRKMTPEDVDFLYRINTTKEILKLCGDPNPSTYEQILGWLNTIQNTDHMQYIIIEKDTNVPIGYAGLQKSPLGYNLGYMLDIPFWGKGYATEVAKKLIEHGKSIGIKRILATRDIRNETSGKVLQKCGFIQTGVGFVLSEDGASFISTVEYQLNLEE